MEFKMLLDPSSVTITIYMYIYMYWHTQFVWSIPREIYIDFYTFASKLFPLENVLPAYPIDATYQML